MCITEVGGERGKGGIALISAENTLNYAPSLTCLSLYYVNLRARKAVPKKDVKKAANKKKPSISTYSMIGRLTAVLGTAFPG